MPFVEIIADSEPMTRTDSTNQERNLAEAVRDACLRAALAAYEDASIRGVCHEGAWECAVGAVRSLDVDALVGRTRMI